MRKSNIAILGPIIIDDKSSGGEGEKLYHKLKESGYVVYKRSGYRNKLLRLIDTVYFMIAYRKKYDTIVSLIFSGRAFVLEYIIFVIAKILNKKIIGVLHGGALNQFYHTYPNMVEKLYNQCIHICTPSKFLQQYFVARGWPVSYLPNFIDNTYFTPKWTNTNGNKLLWVRGFHEIYNPELAIKCVAALKHEFPDISLTMVGPDMGKLEACKALSKELGVANQINFVGFVPNSELQNYYHSHTIFLTTTQYESFGVALVEAASCGIPMVSTRVGEIPFLWKEGEEMLMAENNNQEAFNSQVKRLLNNSSLRDKLSINAHAKAAIFTWDHIKNKWNKLIED